MSGDKRRQVGVQVHIADKQFFKFLQFSMKQSGLDDMEGVNGWVLGYLSRHRDTDIYQKDLEAEFSIGKSTVTNIVKTLEKAGYIRREDVPTDARLKKLILTDAGEKRHLNVLSIMEKVNDDLVAGIDADALETFYTVLDRMKNNATNKIGDTHA